jgi:hypothetical protein
MEDYRDKLEALIKRDLEDVAGIYEFERLQGETIPGRLSRTEAECFIARYEKYIGIKKLIEIYKELFGDDFSKELKEGIRTIAEREGNSLVNLIASLEG